MNGLHELPSPWQPQNNVNNNNNDINEFLIQVDAMLRVRFRNFQVNEIKNKQHWIPYSHFSSGSFWGAFPVRGMHDKHFARAV